MFKNLREAWGNKELRTKILLTLLLVALFRLGCWLPCPGLDSSIFELSNDSGVTFLGLMSSISGGALANGSLLALGVSPYISAQIIVQLLTVAIPSLEKLAKSGEDGKVKINRITKIVALILGAAQAIGISVAYKAYLNVNLFGVANDTALIKFLTAAFIVIVMVAGAMFTYWFGEKITELGITNGMSLLIYVGILSSAGSALIESLTYLDERTLWTLILFFVTLVVIFGLIVLMDTAERRIQVRYAKQIKGRKMYGGQSNFIPIKLMGTGVLPIIFASSILTFPQLIMSIFWPTSKAYAWYSINLGAGSWIYCILVGLLILFFSYFYAQISFNPEDIAKHVQQNGGFINGIRQGKPTCEHLRKISNRITLFGAMFLAFITIVPSIIFKAIGGSGSLINAFTATGMLIIVSVAIEIDRQLEAQLSLKSVSRGFLK